jgi:hypothetical protein
VHPDAGLLAYYPGTHNVVSFGFYDFGDGEVIMADGTNLMSAAGFGQWLVGEIDRGRHPRKVFLPKRGDVLIWHAALVHEGSPIIDQSRTRKSLVTHYSGASQMPDPYMLHDASGKPQMFEVNGGVVFKHPWVDYARQLG